MASTRKSRTTSAYLKTARDLKSIAPSLSKYGRRKNLKPQEKSAITRAANNVRKAGMGGTLVGLSKQQIKALKGKDLLVGHGLRAVRLRNFDAKRDKLKIEKGEITTERKGARRKWHYKRIRFHSEDQAARDIERFISSKIRSSKKPVDFQIWTGAGRISMGAEGLAAIELIAAFVRHYSGLSPKFEDWFFGIAYSVEN